jgi:hypothetical protein
MTSTNAAGCCKGTLPIYSSAFGAMGFDSEGKLKPQYTSNAVNITLPMEANAVINFVSTDGKKITYLKDDADLLKDLLASGKRNSKTKKDLTKEQIRSFWGLNKWDASDRKIIKKNIENTMTDEDKSRCKKLIQKAFAEERLKGVLNDTYKLITGIYEGNLNSDNKLFRELKSSECDYCNKKKS